MMQFWGATYVFSDTAKWGNAHQEWGNARYGWEKSIVLETVVKYYTIGAAICITL